jgi:hypothetical protein
MVTKMYLETTVIAPGRVLFSWQNQPTHFRTGFDLRKRIQPLWLLLLRSSCYLPAVHVLFDFSWKESCHVVADPLISHFPPGGEKLFFVEIFPVLVLASLFQNFHVLNSKDVWFGRLFEDVWMLFWIYFRIFSREVRNSCVEISSVDQF